MGYTSFKSCLEHLYYGVSQPGSVLRARSASRGWLWSGHRSNPDLVLMAGRGK